VEGDNGRHKRLWPTIGNWHEDPTGIPAPAQREFPWGSLGANAAPDAGFPAFPAAGIPLSGTWVGIRDQGWGP